LRLLVAAVAGLLACRGPDPAQPALRGDEQLLVDLYVRIAEIESRRSAEPDSVGPALDRLAASADSVAVRRALSALERDPARWQQVFDAIVQRLQALEEDAGAGRTGRPPAGEISDPGPAGSPSKPRIP
jgi:hypothetical protein